MVYELSLNLAYYRCATRIANIYILILKAVNPTTVHIINCEIYIPMDTC